MSGGLRACRRLRAEIGSVRRHGSSYPAVHERQASDRGPRSCRRGHHGRSRRATPACPIPVRRLSGMALGIDVGGTGVKAALVDLATAQLVGPRIRERTPQPSTPEAVDRDHRIGRHQGARGSRHARGHCRLAAACRASSRTVAWRARRTSTRAGSAGRPRTTSGRPSVGRCSSSMTRMRPGWRSWPMVRPRAAWARCCC